MAWRVINCETRKPISEKLHLFMSDAQKEQGNSETTTEVVFDSNPVTREKAGYRSKPRTNEVNSRNGDSDFGYKHVSTPFRSLR